MGGANASQQLVCKWQLPDALDFVDENDDALLDVLQKNLGIKLNQALAALVHG